MKDSVLKATPYFLYGTVHMNIDSVADKRARHIDKPTINVLSNDDISIILFSTV